MTERRYGKWLGKPDGWPEDPTRCIEEVLKEGERPAYQCSRHRGFGRDGLYCEKHAREHKMKDGKA